MSNSRYFLFLLCLLLAVEPINGFFYSKKKEGKPNFGKDESTRWRGGFTKPVQFSKSAKRPESIWGMTMRQTKSSAQLLIKSGKSQWVPPRIKRIGLNPRVLRTTATSSWVSVNPVDHARPPSVSGIPNNIVERSFTEQKETIVKGRQERNLNFALFGIYLCNMVAVTIPILIVPLVAAERALVAGPNFVTTSFIGSLASIAIMGAALGKFVNGFVCGALGGRVSSSLYLLGMAGTMLYLSVHQVGTSTAWILACLEFFASIQWTACSVVLSNHHKASPEKVARGVTMLGLASTTGMLTAKIGGVALLQLLSSWRIAAGIGVGAALVGSICMWTCVTEYPIVTARGPRYGRPSIAKDPRIATSPSIDDIWQSFQRVVYSPLFWSAGVAHATLFLARTSDRVLGAFFRDATALPQQLCGGLTVCVTLGLIHGLRKASKFHSVDKPIQIQILRRAYAVAVVSTLGLAAVANQWLADLLVPSSAMRAAAISILASGMASSLSFQYYQIPTIVSKFFGEDQAVCLSFLDGLGYTFSAVIWAMVGALVAALGDHAWSGVFCILAAFFAVGRRSMMGVLPQILVDRH